MALICACNLLLSTHEYWLTDFVQVSQTSRWHYPSAPAPHIDWLHVSEHPHSVLLPGVNEAISKAVLLLKVNDVQCVFQLEASFSCVIHICLCPRLHPCLACCRKKCISHHEGFQCHTQTRATGGCVNRRSDPPCCHPPTQHHQSCQVASSTVGIAMRNALPRKH